MPLIKISPRNQPKQERSFRTRREILQATARLLNRHDEPEVSTNHIAKATGISIGTLYKHYPNKDAILSDLIDLYMESDLKGIQEVLSVANKSPEQTAELFLGWVIDTHKTQHKLRAVLYSNLGRLLKNPRAVQTRAKIGERIMNSPIGNLLESPHRMLMTVAAINAMIHVVSQLPSSEEDWESLKKVALRILR